MAKRILFVHHVAAIGGGSYCMLNLVKTIDRTRFEPHILLGEDGPLADEFDKMGIPVDVLSEITPFPYNKALYRRSCIERYFAQPASKKAFDRYLATHPGFDVVYLNNLLLCPLLPLGKKHGCKTVIHIREHWPENEHVFQLSVIRRMIKKWADCVIAINSYSASVVGLPERTAVVYDWVDFFGRRGTETFKSIFGGETSNLKFFLYVGGFNPIKGIHEVVKVFHDYAGKDCRLLIVGNPPEHDTGIAMKRTCGTIRSDSRIKCIPGTYKILQLIEDAYCTLSFFTIPHANLFLAESIICRTVAIAAGTEEAYEYSEDGRLARIFKFGDKKAFAKALNMPEEDYRVLKKHLEESSEKVRLMFDRNRNVILWHKAIGQLCGDAQS